MNEETQMRGKNNGRDPMFNPGFWPVGACICAQADIEGATFDGIMTKYFSSEEEFKAWFNLYDSLNEIRCCAITRWPLNEPFADEGTLMARLSKV